MWIRIQDPESFWPWIRDPEYTSRIRPQHYLPNLGTVCIYGTVPLITRFLSEPLKIENTGLQFHRSHAFLKFCIHN
jgi:hypothetical protein